MVRCPRNLALATMSSRSFHPPELTVKFSNTSAGSSGRLVRLLAGLLALASASSALANAPDVFQQQVTPFLQTYCTSCHNSKTTEGELDLTRYQSSTALSEAFRQWEHIVTFLKKQEMPPEKAKQPTDAERAAVLEAIERLLAAEAKKLAGDPGVVLPRRLTNAEYDYTVRDLTGVGIRPAESFPIDPASGEGFNNTGEALVMSPSLFKKYYAAAQHVADHVAFAPGEMRFAPFPVVTFADRVKLFEQAIIRFYDEHNVKYESYLTAAWSYRYRPAARQNATLEQWAAENKLSSKYLRTLWDTLSDGPADEPYYLGPIRRQWNSLPPPSDTINPTAPDNLARQVSSLAGNIRGTSKLLCAKETPAIVSNAGNAPVQHIARRRKTAAERDTVDESAISDRRRFHVEFRKLPDQPGIKIHLQATNFADGTELGFVVLKDINFSTQNANDYKPGDKSKNTSLRKVLEEHAPDEWAKLRPGVHPLGQAIDAGSIALSTSAPIEITVPTKAFPDRQDIRLFAEVALDREHSKSTAIRFSFSDRPAARDDFGNLLVDPNSSLAAELRESAARLCRTFPNRFVYVDDTRGLSAGFHLIEGVFRDDTPLCKLVLSDEENRQLNRLWDELYFGTGMTEKMLRGFVFFERSERNFLKHADFDSFKEEDPELVKDATLQRFEQAYLSRSGVALDDPKLAEHPVHLFFADLRQGLARRIAQMAAAKPSYLRQLLELAERAYRRPLAESERKSIEQFYESTCRQAEFGVEQAVRGVVTSLLVSPYFCCRIDVPPAGETVKPLSDIALASRLSYFLWSSMPDDELLSLAKAGKLNDESTLRRQTRRMLTDEKVSALALEFFGQWLRYREFSAEESVDRRVFPAFDDQLKQAMFAEPTRLITHLIQNDLPVTDVLYGDTTFVNKQLAQHYGWPFTAAPGDWQRVDGIQQQGRGGVLGMAVFLTMNSQPQRTSPVKRGFWVVHKILGEHIPPPPADVAVLPAKETETDGKTIRQLLAQHVEMEACGRCHRRFDPIGLAMEGFDPIGKARKQDLAGRPVDNAVSLPSGGEAHGVPEFLKYLQSSRNDDYIKTLCHKFLGYALGRSLELSDQELLDKMKSELERSGYRFAVLFETVVCSPQFRNQRCRDFTLARFRSESHGD